LAAADRLVADIEAPLGQQILDVSQAETEAKVQPDGVLDDRRRIVQAGIRDRLLAPNLPVHSGARHEFV